MSRILYLLLALFCSFFTFGQNWQPVCSSKTYFYKHLDSLRITNTIAVDSVLISGADTTYYTQRTIKMCDTCNTIPIDAENGILFHKDWPEFLGTTPQFDFTNNQTITADGIVKHAAEPGSSWLFNPADGITATVVDKFEIVLFGATDSVKVIQLSTLDTILISKNHGIIRYPDFDHPGKYLTLVGYHQGQESFGEYLPNVWRIYDFNVGDVFCFRLENYDDGLWTYSNRNLKLIILEDLSTWDSISYRVKTLLTSTIQYGLIEDAYYVHSAANYIDTLTLAYAKAAHENMFSGYLAPSEFTTFENTLYSIPFSSNCALSDSYFLPNGFYNNVVSHTYDGTGSYSKKFTPMKLHSGNLMYPCSVDGVTVYGSFNEGLGRDSLFTYGFEGGVLNHLKGYIKENDTVGVIFDFPDNLNVSGDIANRTTIYPNPTNGLIYLNNLETGSSIALYQIDGSLLRTWTMNETNSIMLDLAEFANGIYLVSVRDQNGILRTTKVIKE